MNKKILAYAAAMGIAAACTGILLKTRKNSSNGYNYLADTGVCGISDCVDAKTDRTYQNMRLKA